MTPQEELARLMADNPGLPVLKMGGDGTGEDLDWYVLELAGARLGRWWSYDTRVYDDRDDVVDALVEDGMAEAEAEGEADRLPHGRCIWARMDYTRIGEGNGDGM